MTGLGLPGLGFSHALKAEAMSASAAAHIAEADMMKALPSDDEYSDDEVKELVTVEKNTESSSARRRRRMKSDLPGYDNAADAWDFDTADDEGHEAKQPCQGDENDATDSTPQPSLTGHDGRDKAAAPGRQAAGASLSAEAVMAAEGGGAESGPPMVDDGEVGEAVDTSGGGHKEWEHAPPCLNAGLFQLLEQVQEEEEEKGCDTPHGTSGPTDVEAVAGPIDGGDVTGGITTASGVVVEPLRLSALRPAPIKKQFSESALARARRAGNDAPVRLTNKDLHEQAKAKREEDEARLSKLAKQVRTGAAAVAEGKHIETGHDGSESEGTDGDSDGDSDSGLSQESDGPDAAWRRCVDPDGVCRCGLRTDACVFVCVCVCVRCVRDIARRMNFLRLMIQDYDLHFTCQQLRLILRSIVEANDPPASHEYVRCPSNLPCAEPTHPVSCDCHCRIFIRVKVLVALFGKLVDLELMFSSVFPLLNGAERQVRVAFGAQNSAAADGLCSLVLSGGHFEAWLLISV